MTTPRGSSLLTRGRVAAIAIAALGPVCAWGSSCALDGFHNVDAPPAAEVCPHASAPPPPSVSGAGGDVELVVALRSIDMGEDAAPDAGPIGLDLDRVCTCQGEGPSCTPRVPDAGAPCDTEGGRDNAAQKIFRLLVSAFGADSFGSAYYSQFAEQGAWSVLLRVRGYSGEPDDDRVRFDWYISTDYGLGNNGGAPVWGGEDTWPVSSSALNPVQDGGTVLDSGAYSLEDPRYTDPNAYVSGGVLVAALPETRLTLAGDPSTMSLTVSGGFITARIEPMPGVGDGWVLRDGMLVGRWTVSEVFRSIGSFRDDDGLPYCTSGVFYQVGKNQICSSADMLDKPGSPTALCDSISFGVRFETYPARLGAILDPPAPTSGCPGPTDPSNDSCPEPAGP